MQQQTNELVVLELERRQRPSIALVSIGVFIFAIHLPWFAARAADDRSDLLLDEVAAGTDANIALIQCGIAKYRSVEKRFLRYRPAADGGRGRMEPEEDALVGPYISETTVYFDYPQVRFDWHGQRATTDGEIIEYSESTIYDDQYRIYSHPTSEHAFARIGPLGRGQERGNKVHPRQQAHTGWPFYLGTARLADIRSAGGWALTATKEQGGLIKVTADSRRGTGKLTLWLSSDQGYSIVRAKRWKPGESETDVPYQIHQATFRKASNGAFVLDHRVSHTWLDVDGVSQPNSDEEVTLLEIEMRDELNPSTFTLAGLNLPKGAKIIDTVQGKEYAYEVPKVREQDITPPQPSGAIASRAWLIAAYAAVGIVLVGALVWRLRRPRA